MHIEADVMAEVVREKRRNCLDTISHPSRKAPEVPSYISGKIKPKLLQLVFQSIFGDAVQFVQGQF